MSPSRNHSSVIEPSRRRLRLLPAVAALFLVAGATILGNVTGPGTVSAATTAVNQCNGDETGAAREIRCDVTVVNNLDVATGATSSTVTTVTCAGAPGEAVCVTTPGSPSADIVGSVDQCNGSANAGGSIVTCNVSVVNNITGVGSTTPATVNQCIGSGQGGGAEPTTICAPQTSVSGADVTQCNGSGNNGGATGRVTCTVTTSTVSALWAVTINQCNGSANGGGDLVTCTAQISTIILPAQAGTTTTTPGSASTTVAPGATPTTISSGTPGATPTTPGGPSGAGPNPAVVSGALPETGGTTTGLMIATLLAAVGIVAMFVARRRAA